MSRTKRAARSPGVAIAATAAVTMVMPTSNAVAIDHIECRGGEDFLKIWSHLDGASHVDYYANKGRTGFGSWWVDRISTGNNDLIYYDVNGDSVRIDRLTDITFPNNPPRVKDIEVL